MHSPAAPPQRILLLARDGAMNGAERQLLYLAAGMDRTRYEPVVMLNIAGPLAENLQACGVPVHIHALRDWRRFPGAFLRYANARAAARWARRQNIALVHASDTWKSPHALFLARQLNVPAVVHVRGPLSPHDIGKHGLHRAAAVIAIGTRYRDALLAARLDPARVCIVDDAVDAQRFIPAAPGSAEFRREFNLDSRLAVGLVGRVEPFKRILEFLEAVALAHRQCPAATYFVIGQPGADGYVRQIRAAVARLGLGTTVVFTGRRDDMPAVLAGLDLLTTFSGGSVMFEAMAAGRPVLSVRSDHRHSVHLRHDHTGWCVSTAEPQPAAEALCHLLRDAALRARLAATGRAWVVGHLSPRTLVERTQAVYDSLLGAC